ncbi:YihY/virulence factor BrkB family protein [Salsipaludibacter albus]|uniref:YihY/virulence factor BrkB family protein n=1 Tax=Salsipaludibacter albus TaxID=2849650 RepID=UPI001EE4373B|nr:YihY/virulence factor BrkB family protein [Salsipaludibacter albus]MBY5161362.1 YihY/virulence factor BrkB family protein [Salsipaludibacter albus]
MADRSNEGGGRHADSPGDVPSSGWKAVASRVVAEIKADNVPVVAAGVAFYAWLALIPTLIALLMVYGLVADPATVTSQLDQLTSQLSNDVASVIQRPIESATQVSGLSLGLVAALAGVLWSASGGMDGLIKGVNIAYDEEPRSFPRRRGLAILLTLGAILFLVVLVTLIGVVPPVIEALGLGTVGTVLAQVARWLLVVVLMMAGVAVVYRIAPHREDPKLGWVTPGAVVATVLWALGSVGFSLYVSNFGSYNQTYGALAGVIVLDLWLFLSAFCVLLGAEINAELEAQTAQDTTTGPPEPLGQRGAVKADTVAAD